LGAFAGAVGQLVRAVSGLARLNRDRQTGDSTDSFQASTLIVSLIIGATAGALAALVLADRLFPASEVPNAKAPSVSVELILGLMAAGYTGAAFIEGFAGKHFQVVPGAAPTASDTVKTAAERAAQGVAKAAARVVGEAKAEILAIAQNIWLASRPSGGSWLTSGLGVRAIHASDSSGELKGPPAQGRRITTSGCSEGTAWGHKRAQTRCLLAIALAMSGCAQLVVDRDGNRHLAGFMVLTLPPAQADVGADAVRMRTVGLALTRDEMGGTSMVLGYGDTTVATLRNDSIVTKDALLRASQHKPAEAQR
jgi:hypothetical protein